MNTPFDHSGSAFDSFLEEEGILDEVEAVAIKRVIAWQLVEAMKAGKISKKAMPEQGHQPLAVGPLARPGKQRRASGNHCPRRGQAAAHGDGRRGIAVPRMNQRPAIS
jgi:hypothetical protein